MEAVGISDRIEVQRREYVGVFTTLLQSYAAELLERDIRSAGAGEYPAHLPGSHIHTLPDGSGTA